MNEPKKGFMNWWMRNSLLGSMISSFYGSDEWITKSPILSGLMKALLFVVVLAVAFTIFNAFYEA
ncbi:MAG: hypothetical protein WCK68_05895 [Betaproteobacteria bacterium]|jgi:hypothetical protein